ncbi:MAG: YbaB/EbfC family nucleoid-associated protein [Opitutaceae bacterium]
MAGVGKLLKQAQKMQHSIEALQTQLEGRELEATAAGGAVRVRATAAGRITGLTLDPEFLKEEAKVVADTILGAVQDAAAQAKQVHDTEMQKVTAALQMPGLL